MTPNLLDELEKIVALRDAAEYENVYGSAESFAEADNAYKVGAASLIATYAPALADMAKRMEAAERDSKRLDVLEQMANKPGGILLHDGSESGRCGIGLRPGFATRTLREAIDATQEGEG